MSPKAENIISEILIELDGNFEKKEVYATINEKWKIAKRSFDNYWAEALVRFKDAKEKERKAIDQRKTEIQLERLDLVYVDKLERISILSQIAKGEIQTVRHLVAGGVVQEVKTDSSMKDRIEAIAEINKIEGEYAPQKKDFTSDGEKISAPVFNIILTDE